MNCIFTCVFGDENYLEMFFFLLESIFIYGNLSDDTDILVYTSTAFMNKIKKSHLFNKKILFEINDEKNNVDKVLKARLDLFNFDSISGYKKILYLDTNIIVKNDINKLFDVCEKDILYVLEEGIIGDDYWGSALFGDEINNYSDKGNTPAFSGGILLFNNSEIIKNLFLKINENIINMPGYFVDQPYIVYNAFKYNLYDNQNLKSYAAINDYNIHSDKVIHHFIGGPGTYGVKNTNKIHFLNSIKDFTIQKNINKTKMFIDEHLMPIIERCGEPLEGNIFMFHKTTRYTDYFINKTKNISNLLLNTNIKNVMEIGFNSGFSSLLMLMSNPNINLTCFDLGEHTYAIPCYNKIKETFGDRINLIIGDSTETIKNVNDIYDLIHIDGGHSSEVANSDIINSYRLSKSGTILIMDDYDCDNLHELWDSYIIKYKLNPLNINIYNAIQHDIKVVT